MGQCIGRPNSSSRKHRKPNRKTSKEASSSSQVAMPSGNVPAVTGGQNKPEESSAIAQAQVSNGTPLVSTLTFVENRSNGTGREHRRNSTGSSSLGRNYKHRHESGIPVDDLILETLVCIRTLVEVDQEPPRAMLLLHKYAEKESGWIAAVMAMIRNIPLGDPLGPAVVILLLDECPLPTKTSLMKLCERLELSHVTRILVNKEEDVQRHRNICVVLGCLAEKLAGPNSIALMSETVLEYLIANLKKDNAPTVILSALIALEKFALTSDNKAVIERRLMSKSNHSMVKRKKVDNPLDKLQDWLQDPDYVKRQIGFCAQWSLDNLFVTPKRKFTYETVDMKNINVMLNVKDVSEYLKLAPNGLEARCDVASFESVRCTFQVNQGVWYYEVLIITNGVMQIGLATKQSKFLNYEGHGIGDDEFSIAYDGCRQLVWYNAKSSSHQHSCWKPGDVLGVLLDVDQGEVIFSLNGDSLDANRDLFKQAKNGFFAAASFMSFQQCEFNFGAKPFQHPPDRRDVQTFNHYGVLNDEDKRVLPRPKLMETLQTSLPAEGACELCFDNNANMQLLPCGHTGFCNRCALQLEACPLCRYDIEQRVEVS